MYNCYTTFRVHLSPLSGGDRDAQDYTNRITVNLPQLRKGFLGTVPGLVDYLYFDHPSLLLDSLSSFFVVNSFDFLLFYSLTPCDYLFMGVLFVVAFFAY